MKTLKTTGEHMLLAAVLLKEIAATLRFATCNKCGNEQPFVVGRGIPNCESCGEHDFKKVKRGNH